MLTTMSSRYVVASFKREDGRENLKTFLRLAQGHFHFTPPILQ